MVAALPGEPAPEVQYPRSPCGGPAYELRHTKNDAGRPNLAYCAADAVQHRVNGGHGMTDWIQTSPEIRPSIGWSDVWRQFCADILSKEVQTSPTYSYQWMACEVGHIGLGMVLFFAMASAFGWPSWVSLVAVAGAAVAKEGRDVYVTNKKISNTFDARLDKRTVRIDALLAVVYMVLGAMFAFGVAERWPFWAFMLWLAPVVAIMPWCLRQKMYFQQAGLPYLFRLPEFTAPLRDNAVTLIKRFLASAGSQPPQHLVILGPLQAGKTSLAVGIGTEATFMTKVVRYLTFTKLCEIGIGGEPPAPRNTALWRWRQSQLVIVDDVVGGLDLFRKDRAPSRNASLNEAMHELKDELASRHVIWVVQDEGGQSSALQWSAMIQNALGSSAAEFAWITVEKSADNDKAMSITGAAQARQEAPASDVAA